MARADSSCSSVRFSIGPKLAPSRNGSKARCRPPHGAGPPAPAPRNARCRPSWRRGAGPGYHHPLRRGSPTPTPPSHHRIAAPTRPGAPGCRPRRASEASGVPCVLALRASRAAASLACLEKTRRPCPFGSPNIRRTRATSLSSMPIFSLLTRVSRARARRPEVPTYLTTGVGEYVRLKRVAAQRPETRPTSRDALSRTS